METTRYVELTETTTWGGLVPTEWKKKLLEFFSRDKARFDYHIGDLDDFLFPYCHWIVCFSDESTIEEVILMYQPKEDIPTLLIFPKNSKNINLLHWLIKKAKSENHLPKKFYCHYANVEKILIEERFNLESLGAHFKFTFKKFPTDLQVNSDGVEQITPKQKNEVLNFYKENYPHNYFTEKMLETNRNSKSRCWNNSSIFLNLTRKIQKFSCFCLIERISATNPLTSSVPKQFHSFPPTKVSPICQLDSEEESNAVTASSFPLHLISAIFSSSSTRMTPSISIASYL